MTNIAQKQAAKSKVMVGLSGGVDSAVTALTLLEQGYDVSGIFMQNWEADRDDPFCTAEQDLSDAQAICDQLNIPLQTVSFSKEYWHDVFQYCLDEFAAGRTPNPDIGCNREIKFKALLNHAHTLGAHHLATGHYARIKKIDGEYQLLKSNDENKDQTYFLYTLGQKQLASSLFPIGEMTKASVREQAKKNNFINHSKKDSTGICFIGERKFKDFLSEFLLAQPGNMETPDGEYVGRHDGVMFYTIGQRKGLNIGGRRDSSEQPWYVLGKDVKRNILIVGQGHDHPLLYKNRLLCDQLHWISEKTPEMPLSCRAKIRYRQTDQACQITKYDNIYQVEFEQAQRAITPGQSIVFYDGPRCLGGAIILDWNQIKRK